MRYLRGIRYEIFQYLPLSQFTFRFPPRIPADPTTADLLSDYHDEMAERTVEVSVNDDKIMMIINNSEDESVTPETTIIETTTLSQPAIEVETGK